MRICNQLRENHRRQLHILLLLTIISLGSVHCAFASPAQQIQGEESLRENIVESQKEEVADDATSQMAQVIQDARDLSLWEVGLRNANAAVEKAHLDAMKISKGWVATQKQPEVLGFHTWRELLDVYQEVRSSSRRRIREANRYGIQSIGGVVDGVMVGSNELPHVGEHYKVMSVHRKRNTNFGTKGLVEAIPKVAEFVAKEHPGAVMAVGNMAHKYGGDLYWSRSHNTGRDVDISFYVRRKSTNERVFLSFFRHYKDNGVSTKDPDLIFDIPTNWTLVKGLLTVENITIQRLFLSYGLKQLLIDYAREQNEPEWLIERAQQVIKQPATAPPHNDHLHVRIACPPNDRLFGCLEIGPQYPWAYWQEHELRRSAEILSQVFRDPSATAKERAQVIEMLDQTESPYRIEIALTWGIEDTSPEVVRRSLKLLEDHWPSGEPQLFIVQQKIKGLHLGDTPRVFPKGISTDAVAQTLYSLLRRLGGLEGWKFALSRVADTSLPDKERSWAADALRHTTNPYIVGELIQRLPTLPASVQEAATRSLEYITMVSDPTDYLKGAKQVRSRGVKEWLRWFEVNKGLPHSEWQKAGILKKMKRKPDDNILPQEYGKLIAMISKEKKPYIWYNLSRFLSNHTDFWTPYEAEKRQDVYHMWTRWWRRNKDIVSKKGVRSNDG